MSEIWKRQLPGGGQTVELTLPSTVDEWELYDEPGASKAAKRLTGAMKRACKRFDTRRRSMRAIDALSKAYSEVVVPVLDKYDDFGAYDTEPRNRAISILQKYAAKVCGGDVYDYDFY